MEVLRKRFSSKGTAERFTGDVWVDMIPEGREPSRLRVGMVRFSPRAQHPNAPGKYVFTSLGLQMAFFPFEQVETISPRPLLMIAGSKADTRYFSEEAIAKAKEPKELFIIPDATHIDLYGRPQFVPQVVSKLTDFYAKHL